MSSLRSKRHALEPPTSIDAPASPPQSALYPEDPSIYNSPTYFARQDPTFQDAKSLTDHQEESSMQLQDLQGPIACTQTAYNSVVPGTQRPTYQNEEGQMDEFGDLDGDEFEDIDLDDLLDLENDGDVEDCLDDLDNDADDDEAYSRLQQALPKTFINNSSSPPNRPQINKSSMSTLSTGQEPTLPRLPHIPSCKSSVWTITEMYLIFEREEAWRSHGEDFLAKDKRFAPYRVKKPSGLRVCWKRRLSAASHGNDNTTI